MKVLVTQLCPTLWDTMDCSLPGSSVHGILQARTLEWVAISFSRGSSQFRDLIQVSFISCIAGGLFTAEDFPGGSDGKASACNEEDPGLIPWRRKWHSTPVFLPGKPHGQRSLVGYSPWCHKESDTTERLHFHFLELGTVNIITKEPSLHVHRQQKRVMCYSCDEWFFKQDHLTPVIHH